MKIKQLFTIMMLLLALTGVAEAKWWIFGQSNEEVSFSYLYLNSVSYEESGLKTSVPKSSLENGELRINGRAKVGKGKIGGVRISRDDRATWQDAKFSDDGTFEFRFRPELAKTYILYLEITDTAGKVNDVDKTRKELTIIESNAQQLVKTSLDELIAAYRSEDPARFMKLVSGEFTGDSANIDRAIRKDFSAFDNIDIRFTLNNVTLDPRGLVFTGITFSRIVTSSKSGKTLSDKGSTELIFKLEEGGAKVFSMKNPLIFGLSDPAEVATGSSGNISDPLIVIDASGNLAKVSPAVYAQLMADGSYRITINADGTSTITTSNASYITRYDGTLVSSGGGSSTVESGTFTLASQPGSFDGFDFALGQNAAFNNDIFLGYMGFIASNSGAQFRDLGLTSINTVTSVPDPATSAYFVNSTIPLQNGVNTGHVYAIKLLNGKYAVIEIVTAAVNFNPTTAMLRYKYQPNGTRNF